MYDVRQRHTADEWRTYLLHVECVRRNLAYRKAYEKWSDVAEDDVSGEWCKILVEGRWALLSNKPLPDPTSRPPLDIIKNAKLPKDCRLPYDERVDPIASKAITAVTRLHPAEHALPVAIKSGLLFLTLFPEQSPNKYVRMVLNFRRNKRSLMYAFEMFVDTCLAARKEAKLSQQSPPHRVRLEECLDCLKVFDLKQSGKTHAEIGERLWPHSHGDVQKRSRVYYQKAKNLIDSPPLMRGRHDEAT